MTSWFADKALSIGRRPRARLNWVVDGACATVLAKIEAGGSLELAGLFEAKGIAA